MAIWIPSSRLANSISHSISRHSGRLFPSSRVPSSSYDRRGYQRSLSSLVYFDKGVAVANKPSGLLCQLNRRKPGEGHVINGELEDFLNDMKQELKLESLPYPMHRLDKLTTGALIFALNQRTARDISQQFQNHKVTKKYLAVVRGGSKTFPKQSGTIQTSLCIDSEGRVSLSRPESTEGKKATYKVKDSITHWDVLSSSTQTPLSLLNLKLETGIKHQLRIHLARVLSAPILGDTFYSRKALPRTITDVVNVPAEHMYLHASELSFYRYSSSGRQRHVTVMAPLPGYFVRLCGKAGIPLTKDQVKGGVWIDGERIQKAKYLTDASSEGVSDAQPGNTTGTQLPSV